MRSLRMVQLPVPPPAALAATGNVPLAAGCLAVSARVHGLDQDLEIEVVEPEETDSLGDALLADRVARDEPEFVGLSLYLWNVERSLYLAREIKRRSPGTTILIGGPEVSADNPFVLDQEGFDVAVAGEAEASFPVILDRLLKSRDLGDLSGVAVRGKSGLSAFGPTPRADFALERYPSPYLEGFVPVDPSRSTYVETVRGCKSHCTFCFYPRSSNVLRTLDVQASADLIASLRDRGAKEIVFLDPTFNHRPEFVPLLDALAEVNADRSLSFFGEVRAEGLTPDHARRLARAGFTKVEIGLQSVNLKTLRTVKRGGSPAKVAQAAKMLREEGIELLVDLIVGLPGDTVDDIRQGVDYLLEHDLGDSAQVFPLSLLPGTAMRTDAARDGIEFDPAPPYRIRKTSLIGEHEWKEALVSAEMRLGRRLDEFPRPHLVDPDVGVVPCDGFVLDLNCSTRVVPSGPAARHSALWVRGDDLHAGREAIFRAIEERLRIDPYGTLDIVLVASSPFYLNLIDAIRSQLDRAVPSYLSRVLAHRGENLQRRIVAVISEDADLAPDFLDALGSEVPLYRDQSLAQALKDASRLGDSLPAARILDRSIDSRSWRTLRETVDPEAVVFAHREHERNWQRGVLGYGE